MCGIVGYVGPQRALPILISGLKKLEYRGYDSAGVSLLGPDGPVTSKAAGKIRELEARLEGVPGGEGPVLDGAGDAQVGIGHTRWATHGRPSDTNAHPHSGCSDDFVVVHNGIIENFAALKEDLVARGHAFRSETDTEVIPHLLEEEYRGDLVRAVLRVVARLRGSFALAIMARAEPDRLVAVRKDSPLVIGLGDGANFIASDLPAILEHTRRAYILEDGEVAVLTRDSVEVLDTAGRPVQKEEFLVRWDPGQAERAGHPHFMHKEIFEQPDAIRDTLSGRLTDDPPGVRLELKLSAEAAARMPRLFLVACGTAYHAGLVGRHLVERLARLPAEVEVASEFRYRDPVVPEGSLAVIISQSGETADTLAAQRHLRSRNVPVVAVTNVVGSSVAREADQVLYTWAGPEIAVASTKAYTTQLVALTLLAIHLGRLRGTLSDEVTVELVAGIRQLPALARQVLEQAPAVEAVGRRLAAARDIFYIGRGLDYALALEGQLKLKEISYVHAEAYPAGELKHGTLALIEDGVPVIAMATQPDLVDKMASNMREVKARGAEVIAVAMEGDDEVPRHADQVIWLPRTNPLLVPALAAIPLQLLAYYAAVERGCDVDQPRNLAKSVTVE